MAKKRSKNGLKMAKSPKTENRGFFQNFVTFYSNFTSLPAHGNQYTVKQRNPRDTSRESRREPREERTRTREKTNSGRETSNKSVGLSVMDPYQQNNSGAAPATTDGSTYLSNALLQDPQMLQKLLSQNAR